MKKHKLIYWWRVFTVVLFILICLRLVFLRREVVYKGYEATNPVKIEFEIDLCYKTYIESDHCFQINGTSYDEINKTVFNDEIELPISCYTKKFRSKPVKDIISEFENWNISKLAIVKSETSDINKANLQYLLFDGNVCVKHEFVIPSRKNETSTFVIKSNQNNNQKFEVYLTYTRTYGKGGKYRTKKTHLFTRNCWGKGKNSEKAYKCTETGKNIIFEIDYYSAKNLEYPFETNCVIRKGQIKTQNDCYEDCVKEERKYHLLTYNQNDDFLLDYNKTSNLKDLLEKCSKLCYQGDCKTTRFYIEDIHETNSDNRPINAIIINLKSIDYRTESFPLFPIPKLLWMFTTFFSIFFGVNFYGLFLKSTNLYNLSIVRNKKRLKKNKKLLWGLTIVAFIGLSLGLIVEKIVFNFGKTDDYVYLMKESIKERSVSVSVCFDLCNILNDESEFKNNCSEKTMNKTVKELIESTWDANRFKTVASMRNSARIYPIRQDDYEIPVFFRDFKKCFLLYYEAKNYWSHFPLQRISRIHINITNVTYSHFYIEDGYHFPKIESTPAKKSVLHMVDIIKKRPRDGCIYYKDYKNIQLRSRDSYIQDCIIKKSIEKNYSLPTNVNLIINNENRSNLYFFKDDNRFKELEKECENGFNQSDCENIVTFLTYKETFDERDNISINLTPFIYERKPVDDECFLIVLNRIVSFLILFTGFSIKEFSNLLISVYFVSIFSFYNYQSTKRIFYLIMSLLFLIHFLFLFNYLILPMIESSSNHFVYEIKLPEIRFCYKTEIYLDSYTYTFNKLEDETLNFSQILNEIKIYGDDNKVVTKLNFDNFILERTSFYPIIGEVVNFVFKKNGHNGKLYYFYFDDLKCFNFIIKSSKTSENVKIHFKKLQKLVSISFNLKEIDKKKVFIFLNKRFNREFDWNMPFNSSEYNFKFVSIENYYQDDYWYLKNFILWLKNLLHSMTTNLQYDIHYMS